MRGVRGGSKAKQQRELNSEIASLSRTASRRMSSETIRPLSEFHRWAKMARVSIVLALD